MNGALVELCWQQKMKYLEQNLFQCHFVPHKSHLNWPQIEPRPVSWESVAWWKNCFKLIIHSFIPSACAECDDSLLFSGAFSFPLCNILSPATLLHHLIFHPSSPHLAIYFLVYLSILLSPNSYIILFWAFYFLPFSVHVQTNIIYLTLLSLLQ